MVLAGLDNSMSSPAVTIFNLDENLNIISTDYISIFKTKKQHIENHIFPMPDFENECQRITEKNDFLVNELVKRKVEYIAIEDYSFASTGQVYGIGENTGYLKCLLYKNNIKIRKYDPNSIKMAFTGKGNASKTEMMETYKFEYNNLLNLPEKIISTDKPLEDITDSFAICSLLHLEMKLRKGLISLKELPESKIRVFNKVRKDLKTNLLDTEFI